MECIVEDCCGQANVPGSARDMCSRHYNRLMRHGSPHLGGSRRVGYPQNLIYFIDASGGPDSCHPWTGAINKQTGYGVCTAPGTTLSHRAVYQREIGPIEPGHDVGHTCHDRDLACHGGAECLHRRCCNWRHLEQQTRAENLAAGRGGLVNLGGG